MFVSNLLINENLEVLEIIILVNTQYVFFFCHIIFSCFVKRFLCSNNGLLLFVKMSTSYNY